MGESEPASRTAGDRLAVLLVDRQGKAMAASAGFDELFGAPERLKLLDKAGQPLPRAQWPLARLRRGDAFSLPLKLTLSDGARRLFDVSGYPFGGAEGGEAAGVLIFEEPAAADGPGQVAALVSHELRTPLTVLHAALQLMDRALEAGDSQVARQYLEEALAEGRQLDVLTGQLLETARKVFLERGFTARPWTT